MLQIESSETENGVRGDSGGGNPVPRWIKCLSLTIMLAVSLSGPAHATQVLYKSPQDLGTESALAIRGSVQNVESYWNSRHTKIFTKVRISVDQTYKGEAGPGETRGVERSVRIPLERFVRDALGGLLQPEVKP